MKQEAVEILAKQLKQEEDLKLKVYRCPAGKLTIGYGRNLEDRGISKLEALYLLQNDIKDVVNDLEVQLPWIKDLSAPRQAVLLDMAFNLGTAGLLKFQNTLKAIKEGRYNDAAKGMLDSLWAKQVGKRAQKLAEQMRGN